MTAPQPAQPQASRPTSVEAALVLLNQLGITPADLLAAPQTRRPMPTFAEYVPRVRAVVSPGTRRMYGSYWDRVEAQWGDRRLDEPSSTDVKQIVEHTRTHTVKRRNARGGRSAAEHMISALRCLYRHAEDDGLIERSANPARKVAKPRRLPSTRRALPDARLAEVFRVAGSTGDDPELDTLLLRLHIETACRRGGALALRPCDLNREDCLIRLREKGETVREQPVSPTLMRHLCAHHEDRGTGYPDTDPLFRYRSGKPITRRRYDYVWTRVRRQLPWAAAQQISTHWLRHTTLTWVERNFGFATAHAYAGHTDGADGSGNHVPVTITYVRGGVEDVAEALAALTGEPHPLAT